MGGAPYFTVENVVAYIERGVFDSGLDVLARVIDARREARRADVLDQVRAVYGDDYDIQIVPRSAQSAPVRLSAAKSVAVSRQDIEALAREACDSRPMDEVRLLVDYRDAHGVETRRAIDPIRVTASRWEPDTFYLLSRDIEKDETRQFRLDRITRLERTSA